MRRRREWRSKLRVWANAQVGRPFVWGYTDCASLARRALAVMFDREVLGLLPVWASSSEALAVLQAYPIDVVLHDHLGAVQRPFAFMRAGDVIISREPLEETGRVAIFVCVDGRECITSTPEGVRLVTLMTGIDEESPRVYAVGALHG